MALWIFIPILFICDLLMPEQQQKQVFHQIRLAKSAKFNLKPQNLRSIPSDIAEMVGAGLDVNLYIKMLSKNDINRYGRELRCDLYH